MAVPVMRPRRPKPTKPSSRSSAARYARKRVKYTEPASDPEEDDSEDDFEPEETPSPPRATRSTAPLPPSRPHQSSRKRKVAQADGRGRPKKEKLRPFAAVRQSKDKGEKVHRNVMDIHFTGKKMPWQTLPYHVLELVFKYASHPLVFDSYRPTSNVVWLTKVACLCRGFAEPALNALYTSPPLWPRSRAQNFLEALSIQQEGSWINYRGKVKRIDMEALEVLGNKADGPDEAIFGDILRLTPQVQGAGVHFISDMRRYGDIYHPPRRRGLNAGKIIGALGVSGIRLRDWTWNRKTGWIDCLPISLRQCHESEVFHLLSSLTFINYDQESYYQPLSDTKKNTSGALTEALKPLKHLKHLAFQTSDAIDFMKWDDLPDGLQSLNVNNCPIESKHLEKYLEARGRSLRTLVLDHNQHLNLTWMNNLATQCPNLQHLHMDLIYYSPFQTVQNIEPGYDALLSASDKPNWPCKLRSIELHHLRKWDKAVAGNFFQSLVDSASTLPDLRTIRIKASVNESSWRERKEFKDHWVETLDEVFLRKPEPPNPHLYSIAAFQEWKRLQALPSVKVQIHQAVPTTHHDEKESSNSAGESDQPSRSTRRSMRTKISSQSQTATDSQSSRLPPRHRPRERRSASVSSAEDSSLEDDTANLSLSASRSKARDPSKPAKRFIQGMCNIVDIKIDSQRPMEDQLNENDFLDDEVSGDEDWNGEDEWDDGDGDGGGYAW